AQPALGHRSADRRDPDHAVLLRARCRAVWRLSLFVRAPRRRRLARTRFLLRHPLHHRGRADPRFRRRLPLRPGLLHRRHAAFRLHRSRLAHAGTLHRRLYHDRRAAAFHVAHLYRPRHPRGVAGQPRPAADVDQSQPREADRFLALAGHGGARRRAAHHHPAGRALDRPRLYRPRLRDRRLGRHGQLSRHALRRAPLGRRRKPHRDLLRPVLGARRLLRHFAADAGVPPGGHSGAGMKNSTFCLLTAAVVVAFFAAAMFTVANDYFFFAGYVVLQYIVLATAWNILGGYTGYINFGTAGFFAIGAYASVVLHMLWGPPIPLLIVVGGVLSGLVGLGMGVLTLRLRGVFFAIGTLALAIVVQTFVTNWDFVGGSRGVYIIRPATTPLLGTYIHYL